MSQAVHDYDRVLLICSRSSMARLGVVNELEQVLSREAREGGTELLMPVLLDDFVLTEWAPERADLARQVRDRVAADFRKASIDSEFSKQLDRVLLALTLEA
jgi:TIR domain